jgi:hypothetical protein
VVLSHTSREASGLLAGRCPAVCPASAPAGRRRDGVWREQSIGIGSEAESGALGSEAEAVDGKVPEGGEHGRG